MGTIKKKSKAVTIQQKWKEVLDKRGVKQSWLASQTNISPEHISNILSGRALITEENRGKINKALGTAF
jgi:plasmid maintenance system antidote protein VapI